MLIDRRAPWQELTVDDASSNEEPEQSCYFSHRTDMAWWINLFYANVNIIQICKCNQDGGLENEVFDMKLRVRLIILCTVILRDVDDNDYLYLVVRFVFSLTVQVNFSATHLYKLVRWDIVIVPVTFFMSKEFQILPTVFEIASPSDCKQFILFQPFFKTLRYSFSILLLD